MSAGEEGASRCSRKTALSIFFVFELFAFVFCLISLISPTWQYVYLENGRTEHHHGLWLDCKRDYSNEYGRNREYYETLYRLDKQQTPFDQFFLPSLDCVYKFDYYIDTEDLYDHNHDENRLQDDANQHLFLGWKIAALAAFGLAILSSGAALLLCVCAFCHRTFICASSVLVSVSALLSSVGILIFYGWANYQDNSIIKEEDGVYEQYFGWAFYMQIIGTVFHFLASFLGCIATSIAFTKGKAKLVKIEVVDGDESTLLDDGSSQQFKRSFSAIYKVDSAALRRWEREYMQKMKTETSVKQTNFKRAASMPNVKRGQRVGQRPPSFSDLARSSSNVHLDIDGSNLTGTTNTISSNKAWISTSSTMNTPKPVLKSALKQPSIQVSSFTDDNDVTYEVLPCDVQYATRPDLRQKGSILETTITPPPGQQTSINVYDKVYESVQEPPMVILDEYEQPNSLRARNSMSSFGDELSDYRTGLRPTSPLGGSAKSVDVLRTGVKSTVIDDVVDQHSDVGDRLSRSDRWRADEKEFSTSSEFLQLRCDEKRTEHKREIRAEVKRPAVPAKPYSILRESPPQSELSIKEFAVNRKESSDFIKNGATPSFAKSEGISINTFNVGTFAKREGQRSITNLTFSPVTGENIDAFERTDNSDASSLNSFLLPKTDKSNSLMRSVLTKVSEAHADRNKLGRPKTRLMSFVPNEVDRSVGSSTTFENDTMSEPSYDYLRDAELRLNLFMNGVAPLAISDDKTSSIASSSNKEGSVTTV